MLLGPLQRRRSCGEFERRFDDRAIRAFPYQAPICAIAGDQTESVDEDRFARPGLAREQGQTGFEVELPILDQNQLPDA